MSYVYMMAKTERGDGSSQGLNREPLSKDEIRAIYQLCPGNIDKALTRTLL